MVSSVNLCYYVNQSSQVIQYQEQSSLAFPLLVKSKWPMDVEKPFGHQMASTWKATKFPSLTRLTFWKTLSQTICHTHDTPKSWFVHTGWHATATYFYQPSPDLLWDMHTDSRSGGDLDWSYHPGSIKAQERLRRSSPEIILAGSAVRQPYYS